jgi:hypothetical protein
MCAKMWEELYNIGSLLEFSMSANILLSLYSVNQKGYLNFPFTCLLLLIEFPRLLFKSRFLVVSVTDDFVT